MDISPRRTEGAEREGGAEGGAEEGREGSYEAKGSVTQRKGGIVEVVKGDTDILYRMVEWIKFYRLAQLMRIQVSVCDRETPTGTCQGCGSEVVERSNCLVG